MKNILDNREFPDLVKYHWWDRSSSFRKYDAMSVQQKIYLTVTFVLLLLTLIFLIASNRYNCEWLSVFYYVYKYFSIPVCVFCLLIVLKFKFLKDDLITNIGFAIGLAIMVVATIGTFLPILNATIGPQEKEFIEGHIINKSVTSGRHASEYSVIIYANKLEREMKFAINKDEYDNIEINKPFKVEMYKGYFGFYYTNKNRRLFTNEGE